MSEQTTEQTIDLTVVGSGGAGLVAAVRAAASGLRVTVVEGSPAIGGTTAMSGGLIYAPGNSLAAAEGITDDGTEVRRYLQHIARLPLDKEALETFLDTIPAAIDFLTGQGARFRTSVLPDYYADAPGATTHRSLGPQPFDPASLGALASAVRRTPYRAVPDGEPWTNGMAVIGHLLTACAATGVEIRTDWRAKELLRRDGAVVGVRGESGGREEELWSPAGVVLAGGGFEFDRELLDRFVADPVEGAWSCPRNVGDVLRMALDAGAVPGEADVQWYPLLRLTDSRREGAPRMDDASPARNLPGTVVVDSTGRRFTNEGGMYQDFGRRLAAAVAAGPCWLITDDTFLTNYRTRAFGDTELSAPQWVSADSLARLAQLIDVDAAVLEETVERFNRGAAAGVDAEFDRGRSAFDQAWGDDRLHGPRSCLAPVERGPFHATRMYAGCSGTTGGMLIDTGSRVLGAAGRPVPGLFAAGNAVANPFGGTAPGSGGTLGPGFVTGYQAGLSAVSDHRGAASAAGGPGR